MTDESEKRNAADGEAAPIMMPCDAALRKAVEQSAKSNGRSMGREVAQIVAKKLKVPPTAAKK